MRCNICCRSTVSGVSKCQRFLVNAVPTAVVGESKKSARTIALNWSLSLVALSLCLDPWDFLPSDVRNELLLLRRWSFAEKVPPVWCELRHWSCSTRHWVVSDFVQRCRDASLLQSTPGAAKPSTVHSTSATEQIRGDGQIHGDGRTYPGRVLLPSTPIPLPMSLLIVMPRARRLSRQRVIAPSATGTETDGSV